MNVQIPEGDRSSSSSTTSATVSVLLQRQGWIRKDMFRCCKNVVEKVKFQVPSGEQLGFLVLYCKCLSTGERRASGRIGNIYKMEEDDEGRNVLIVLSGHVGWGEEALAL